MLQKNKKCKGIGKAFGFNGCGNLTFNRKFGLCMNCYPDFILNDERGKIIMQKSMIKAKKTVHKEQIKKQNEERQKTKIELMSPDKYRAEHLQPIINEIARIIDFGQSCIATGDFGKMNGGHYVSVGANRTTALNLHNIHIQSFASNHHKSGDPIKYRLGLIERYGNDYFEYVQYIQQHKALHLTKGDMITIALKAASIRNELKRNEEQKTPIERIELRNQINLRLGIYDPKFCEFLF
jgi:hypothetical protein